ncbi:hypothetical protein J6590_024078 [Homalodisca vitripennis]|nr:hypothetical protein J6590_024078 [Homalodisca vitripennis]
MPSWVQVFLIPCCAVTLFSNSSRCEVRSSRTVMHVPDKLIRRTMMGRRLPTVGVGLGLTADPVRPGNCRCRLVHTEVIPTEVHHDAVGLFPCLLHLEDAKVLASLVQIDYSDMKRFAHGGVRSLRSVGRGG